MAAPEPSKLPPLPPWPPQPPPPRKRFFRNRESGYKGWIDQDGYRCDSKGKRTGGDA
jgi:hypothetical protein